MTGSRAWLRSTAQFLACAALAFGLAAGGARANPVPAASAAKAPAPLDLNARVIPLGGKLDEPQAWAAYKSRFITADGRVIDTANGNISHSEGQGYGMLLAVAANDRATFDRIFGWTRANLMVRPDALMAWRFDPDKRPGISDTNNATDGDVLVAWALSEASRFWRDPAYSVEANRIAAAIAGEVMVKSSPFGPWLLPAVRGFNAPKQGGASILNLSYFVFPAFERLQKMAPEGNWQRLVDSGLALLRSSRFGPAHLPAEWESIKGDKLAPAPGFPAEFAYNALRIPLYMAFAGVGERADYQPFATLWDMNSGPLSVISLTSGTAIRSMGEPGYSAIAALVQCVVSGASFPNNVRVFYPLQNYYPATLQMLSLLAAHLRYPSCLRP
ncbi:MAG: cellulase [Hyphomicrobiales bacterium]|nr:cellulase [Hyphomicrobiales bacterium]